MKKFFISFHVDELDEAGAREWLSRALKILEKNQELLIQKSSGAGKWCTGHINEGVSEAPILPRE